MGYGYGYDYKHNKRLHKMIKKYGKGYRDVRVWQLSPDRYVMCYMNAGHYFMRELNTIYNTITSPMRVLLNDGYWTVYGAPNRYYVPNGPSINVQFNLYPVGAQSEIIHRKARYLTVDYFRLTTVIPAPPKRISSSANDSTAVFACNC